jgi:hypothetical protein
VPRRGESVNDLSGQSSLVAPVFVVGCRGSGTALLGACLSAHSALAAADESKFLRPLSRIYYSQFHGRNERKSAPLRGYISDEAMIACLRGFADGVFLSLLQRLAKGRYLDVTPEYVNCMPFIDLLYPTAQFVHVIRDGRYVVESLGTPATNSYRWVGNGIGERAEFWRRSVTNGRQAGVRLNRNRYRELRYEEMRRAPAQAISDILEFLGLAPEAPVLRPLAERRGNPAGVPFRPVRALSPGRLRAGTGAEDAWPPEWTENDRREFSRAAGALLLSLGYGGPGKAIQ